MTRPIYVVGPAGPARDRVGAALSSAPRPLELADLEASEPPPPGVVLILADEVPAETALAVMETLARGEGEWTPCLVRGDEVRPASLGWPHGLADVQAFAEGDDDQLIELRRALKRISRARHDVNNPLTSGMAETQLLLMDVEDPEFRAALETIQTQLRRIRDLVAATGGLRVQ